MISFFRGIGEKFRTTLLAPGAKDPHYDESYYEDDDYDYEDDDRYYYEDDYSSRERDSRGRDRDRERDSRDRDLRDVREPVSRNKTSRGSSSRVFDPAKVDNVLGFNAATGKKDAGKPAETIISHPNGVEDAIQLGNHVRHGRMCIVDLTGLDKVEAQRVVDYLSGVCMALDGVTTRVNHGIFTVSPPNHRVTATYGNPDPKYDDGVFSSRSRDAR